MVAERCTGGCCWGYHLSLWTNIWCLFVELHSKAKGETIIRWSMLRHVCMCIYIYMYLYMYTYIYIYIYLMSQVGGPRFCAVSAFGFAFRILGPHGFALYRL